MAHIGGHTSELEGLEAGPAEEGSVLGGKAAEELCDVFVRVVGAHGLLLCRGHLGDGVLAEGFVRWPMLLLALWGLLIYGSAVGSDAKGTRGGMLTQ